MLQGLTFLDNVQTTIGLDLMHSTSRKIVVHTVHENCEGTA